MPNFVIGVSIDNLFNIQKTNSLSTCQYFHFFSFQGQLNYKLTIYYQIFKLFSLISKCLLLQNVTIKPSGQTTKVSDSICSVPVDTFDVTNLLPRPVDSNTPVMKVKNQSVRVIFCLNQLDQFQCKVFELSLKQESSVPRYCHRY